MSIESIVAAGQRLIETTMLDRCYLRDRTKVRDTSGGWRETWIERPKAVRCRFVQVNDDDPTMRLESNYGRASAVLQLPLGTVFLEGDRVRNAKNNKVWVIVTIITPPSELATMERAGIKEV